MKKLLLIITIIFLFSCESKKDIQTNINTLKNQRISLVSEVSRLNDSISIKQNQINVLNKKLLPLNIYASGRTPKYILKIHLKQVHYTLNISKHIKDLTNAIDFEIPVDKDFYNSVSEGTEIVDRFRVGSLILSGSFGNWRMTVKEKIIK